MLAVLAGGGTAGHINPALALAEELKSRGVDIVYAGTPEGLESRLVPLDGIEYVGFNASGYNRTHPTTLVTGTLEAKKSEAKARKWLAGINANVVVCFGGYVSLPIGWAAKDCKIPLVVHEQNSYMGMTNRNLSKHAAATCLTYEVAAKGTEAKNVCVTGNPVRGKVVSATREEGREMLGIPDDATVLLVFGGSQGARHINQAVCAMKDALLAVDNLYVVHITGPKELDSVTEALALTPEQQKRWLLFGYQNRMGETLAAADAVVSRAGATSLAEISVRCVPALLVPFPHATDDHQTTNAKTLVEQGCALLVADADVETEEFSDKVMKLVTDADMRANMAARLRDMDTVDAVSRLADVVMRVAR